MKTSALVIAGLISVVGFPAGHSQEPIRAGVVRRPKVGERAPELVLPYFTSAGPGPTDQPFRRSAELGRVLVIVFGPPDDNGWWNAVARVADSGWSGAVFVGVVRGSPESTSRLAGGLPNDRAKLLADPTGQGWRGFGVARTARAGFVVGDDGRVAAVVVGFSPSDSANVGRIASAARDAGRP